jgi:hypothetical protein
MYFIKYERSPIPQSMTPYSSQPIICAPNVVTIATVLNAVSFSVFLCFTFTKNVT